MKNLFKLLSVVVATFLLSGCYETPFSVVDKGENVALSGSYKCQSVMKNRPSMISFTESQGDNGFKYDDNMGAQHIFQKLNSGLFLGQSVNEVNKFSYFYFDFISDKKFSILLPNTVDKQKEIDQLLAQFSVESKTLEKSVVLNGEKGQIFDFMAAHDKKLLVAVMQCDQLAK